MAEKKAPRIKVTKDGPYLVSGGLPLDKVRMVIGSDGEPEKWAYGDIIPTPDNYALCRCGRSANKPFCDGSHAKTGFDGRETAARRSFLEMAEKNIGPGIDLYDVPCYCVLAMFCHRSGDTWTLAEKSDDPENKRIAVEEAGDCPGGRLVAWDKALNKPIEPRFTPGLSLIEDTKHYVSGPIWAKGGIPIEAADGYQYEVRNRATLCRCGCSKNKPFCDGAHVKSVFDDGDEALK